MYCSLEKHNTCGFPSFQKTIEHLKEIMPNYATKVLESTSHRECCEQLKKLFGIGDFLAWQICCDLEESSIIAFDDDWVYLGPGAVVGLKILFPGVQHKQSELLPLLHQLCKHQENLFAKFNLSFCKWNNMPISNKNMEHALCEFSKYYALWQQNVHA